jgi:hypothetical protein
MFHIVALVDKIQRLSPAGLANFRQLGRVGGAPSVRFYPLEGLGRAIRPAALILMSCMVSLTSANARAIWFGGVAPPVVGHNGQASSPPSDYMELFKPQAPWSGAIKHVTVLAVTTRFLLQGTDNDLSAVFQDLKRRHIALAVGLGFLGGQNCGNGVEGFAYPTTAAALARRIRDLGGELNYLAMDEPLFFGHQYLGPSSCKFPIAEIARQVAVHVREMRQVFPKLQVGDMEPIGSDDPKDRVAEVVQWIAAYRGAMGEPLAFLQADVQWAKPWKQELGLLADSLHSAHVDFGIIYDGNNSDTTGREWVRHAEERFVAVEADPALVPDQAILASWMPQPEHNLPETDPEAMTYLVNRYAAAPSHIAVQRTGASISGRLTDGAGRPIERATVKVVAVANAKTAIMVVRKLTGVVPPGAASAIIGLRINDECGCSGPANVAIGRMAYHDNRSGQLVQRQFGLPDGKATVPVSRFVATEGQKIGPNTTAFPVTPGDPFTIEVPMSANYDSDEHGVVTIIFLTEQGHGISRVSLPFHPSTEAVGTTATDTLGRFVLPLASALPNSNPSFLAAFDGNDQYRLSSMLAP